MKKIEWLLSGFGVASLTLAGFTFYWTWKLAESAKSSPEPPALLHFVQVNPHGNAYRIYIMVNHQTIIAHEYNDYRSYPINVTEHDKIEIDAYSDMSITITLEDFSSGQLLPVANQTGQNVTILYHVPEH